MDASAFDPKRLVQPVLRVVVLYLSLIVISTTTMINRLRLKAQSRLLLRLRRHLG